MRFRDYRGRFAPTPDPDDWDGVAYTYERGRRVRVVFDSEDGWRPNQYLTPFYLDGRWLADPSWHGYTFCDYGDHYVDSDYWDRGRHGYCPSCASEYESERAYDDGDYEDDYCGSTPRTTSVRCSECGDTSEVTHHHPVLDRIACATCANTVVGYEPIPTFELVAA